MEKTTIFWFWGRVSWLICQFSEWIIERCVQLINLTKDHLNAILAMRKSWSILFEYRMVCLIMRYEYMKYTYSTFRGDNMRMKETYESIVTCIYGNVRFPAFPRSNLCTNRHSRWLTKIVHSCIRKISFENRNYRFSNERTTRVQCNLFLLMKNAIFKLQLYFNHVEMAGEAVSWYIFTNILI